jgi:hypothetical protein
MPKFKPNTVKGAYPECGAFISDWEAIGASKLSTPQPVPTSAATVTSASRPSIAVARALQTTAVAELQDVVVHAPSNSCAVPVGSADAKPSPATVTDAPPVRGMLCIAPLTTAASKLSRPSPVPTTLPTVATKLDEAELTAPLCSKH